MPECFLSRYRVQTYVGDDIGVQSIALAAVTDQSRIRGEEGALGRLAVELCTTELEVHGGCARAKVSAGQGRRGRGTGVGGARDADQRSGGEREEGGEDESSGIHFVGLFGICGEDRLVENECGGGLRKESD